MPKNIIIFYTNLPHPPFFFISKPPMSVAILPQTSKRHATNKSVCRKPTWMFATSDNLLLYTTS